MKFFSVHRSLVLNYNAIGIVKNTGINEYFLLIEEEVDLLNEQKN